MAATLGRLIVVIHLSPIPQPVESTRDKRPSHLTMWPAVRLATDGADRHRGPPVSGGPLSFTLPARPQRHDSFRRVCEFCTSLRAGWPPE